MFRFFLYNFFKVLSKPYETLNEDAFSKYISDEKLINEILIIKQFKHLWRKKIGSNISKEKYKIKDLKINKISRKYYLKISVLHSFKLNNANIISKELLRFNFLIKNKKISFMENKEYNLLNSGETFSNLFKKNRISKLEFYSEKINNLDKLYIEYLKFLPNLQRSNTPEISQNNKSLAISYARKYALNYNPKYKDFDENGGDCTNFISQCLAAGNIPLSKTWRPYSNTWLRVNELYYYLSRKSIGTPTSLNNTIYEGDILQFFSNSKGFFAHSCIITKVLNNNDFLYCCHSYDKLDFPLSEVYPIIYNKLRFLNIHY